MYSYRNRDRLVDRIKARRQQLSPEERGDDDLDDDDDEPGTSRRSMRSRRSGVHFNEADRKVLEEALDAIPNPRDARALTRLWTQLEAEVSTSFGRPTDHVILTRIYSILNGLRQAGRSAI